MMGTKISKFWVAKEVREYLRGYPEDSIPKEVVMNMLDHFTYYIDIPDDMEERYFNHENQEVSIREYMRDCMAMLELEEEEKKKNG